MPSEYRVIFFDPTEIARGAIEWKRQQGAKVPSRKIVRMEVQNKTLDVKLYFADEQDKVPPLELRSEEVVAALLTFCRKVKIPLPMRAVKNLVRQGEQLAFMISMPTELDPPTVPIEYTGRVGAEGAGEKHKKSLENREKPQEASSGPDVVP